MMYNKMIKIHKLPFLYYNLLYTTEIVVMEYIRMENKVN